MQGIIRKIVTVGNSKGLTLPRDWLAYHKRKYGKELKEVYVTISEMVITVVPIAPTDQEKKS